MTDHPYHFPEGGVPPQSQLLTGRAIFTDAYAVIPGECLRDIVTSQLPFWQNARFWVLARPLTGFAETFSQCLAEVQPGGGSAQPEQDPRAEAVIFVLDGAVDLRVEGEVHHLTAGGFAFLPAGTPWDIWTSGDSTARFHWIRKAYVPVEGLGTPDVIIANEAEVDPYEMPGSDGRWMTTRFVGHDDLRHDMHVTIVTLQPGAVIPFLETHVMEHGLYVLEGKGVYRLNNDWVEVGPGDFMWLRAFCPQACYAGGPGPFRYLLYKDVNRHPALW